MHREFSIVRVKSEVAKWEFPLAWDEVTASPLAGPFNQLDQLRIDVAVGCFPNARRTGDGRRAWRVSMQGAGKVDVWVTSDGSVFIEGETSLNLVYALFVHLTENQPNLVIEDRITNVVHNEQSLRGLMRRDEAALVPFDLPEAAA
jgi:hypothetical protein